MEIKRLLKYFAKHGYPTPETLTIMKYSAYNPDDFLGDLVNEIGYENSVEFVRKTFDKISPTRTIKIPLDNTISPGSWIELIINDFEINLDEESSDVLINSHWGDSYFIHPETGETGTFEDSIEDEDPWDYSDLIDDMRSECYAYIQKMCGFGIWFV